MKMLASCVRLSLVLCALLGLSACSVARVPYSADEGAKATLFDIPDARVWADDEAAFEAAQRAGIELRSQPGDGVTLLALSGGGADGAFGAGFLNGWTAAGTRPKFSVVTGVSVGALIAPFAYLGSDYDTFLTQMFTGGDTDGLLQFAGLGGLFGTAAFRDEPLRRLVNKYVDDKLLAAVAREHAKGRLLLVTTTNVDSQRTAIWNMGAIAASDHPSAIELFRSVLLASASFPGIFPPELIEVRSGNKSIRELHVDGGVTANLLVIPEAFLVSRTSILVDSKPQIYVIMNGKLAPDFRLVQPSLINLVERSFGTTIKANTRNALIATRDFVQRPRMDLSRFSSVSLNGIIAIKENNYGTQTQ